LKSRSAKQNRSSAIVAATVAAIVAETVAVIYVVFAVLQFNDYPVCRFGQVDLQPRAQSSYVALTRRATRSA